MRTWFLPVCLMLLLAGCAAPHYANPVGVMGNRHMEPSRRLAAARQAQAANPTDPDRLQALNEWLWSPQQPNLLREYAIDQLIQYDPSHFRRVLPHRVVLITSRPVLDYLFQRGLQLRWPEFTLAAVRSWCRPMIGVTDADRPERQVLEKLNPGRSVEDVIFSVFTGDGSAADIEDQTSAWELLCRLDNPPDLIRRLAGAAVTTPLVADLKACAADLGTVPVNREGVLWLTRLRMADHRNFWLQAKAAVARLNPQQRAGLELRHLAVILHAPPALLAMDRQALLADLHARLDGAQHYLNSPTNDGMSKDYPQNLSDWQRKLCWADLLTIRTILDALDQPAVQAEFFQQADADLKDTSTEYGGVLDWVPSFYTPAPGSAPAPGSVVVPGSSAPVADAAASPAASLESKIENPNSKIPTFRAFLYAPLIREYDTKYIPDNRLFERLYTALAHYHFHVQSYHNRDYAGPGLGDLRLANRVRANFIVLTFIDRNKLNVDYYQPGGAVVDLGCIHR